MRGCESPIAFFKYPNVYICLIHHLYMVRGNFTTGSERYNKRLHKIFDDAREIKKKASKMNYKELISAGYSKETAKYIALENKIKKMAGY